MENTQERLRTDIDIKYKWRLEDIFESTQAWEKALLEIRKPINELLDCKGQVCESPDYLAKTLDLDTKCSQSMMELYVYAKMNKDLDNANSDFQSMYDRIVTEYFKMSADTSFLAPEISAMDEDLLRKWITENEKLAVYSHNLDNLIRNRKHILSEKEETLLSGMGPIVDSVEETFSMLNDIELTFGEVTMPDGQKVKLTHGRFGSLREHADRDVRRQTYENLHTAYGNFKNTIASIYNGSVKSDVFMTRTRGYESCMSRAMFVDFLPVKIYTNLIESIHKALPSFYRYLELRKKILGVEELHLYDCSVPMVLESSREYEFEQSKQILLNAFSPLGEKYLNDMTETLFAGGSIDVYETPGKTSGAYAWGSYQSHPYMLLNWSSKLNDVFTFAHEAGHCMHSFYSNRTQKFNNSHYPIFLAEIASTVNENILLRYLIEQCNTDTPEGKSEKAYLLTFFLEGVKNTVFRQTMFAEFELIVHDRIENGEAMTALDLTELYGTLLSLYFGPGVVIDDYMKNEWARIPHFYNSFYVYKYATGFCAAEKITQKIFDEGDSAVESYLEFLSSGGKDYPANTLGKLGVDMTTPDAVENTIKTFDDNLELLELLLLG
jgi:oligoendopeptidase F